MKKFTEICSGHYFIIPENQRGFSWHADEVEAVFNDLELAGTSSHYMGPIIVTRTDKKDFQDDTLTTTAEFTLEDGQQRITTFFIIINELKKKFADYGEKLEADKLDEILFYQKGGPQLRLQNHNSHLHSCYSNIITGLPPMPADLTPPMMALQSVSKYVSQKVSPMSREELTIWKQRLINQAKFIWVDLATEGVNRYLTFDAINSRGLPLSEFDKIKNFCILVDKVRNLDTYPDISWYNAITQLEKYEVSSRSEEAAFICDLYNVFYDESISQGNVHASFVKKYRALLYASDKALESDFRDFIALWENYAESFGFISTRNRAAYYGQKSTKVAGQWLDRLDSMDLPTITRVLLTSSHFRMSQSKFEKIARACEIYTFRVYAVLRSRKDTNAKNIIKLSNEVLRNNKDDKYVIDRICEWLQKLAPLKIVIEKLANSEPKYNFDSQVKGWQHCYYFLYEYEMFCSPSGVGPLPWGKDKADKINSQEHILPQTHRDNGWWQSHWPDEAEADKYKHRLGNLVLTAHNSVLQRRAFPIKLTGKSHPPIPGETMATYYYNHVNASNSEKRICNFTDGIEWKQTNILQREIEMLTFASKRWNIPCCSDDTPIYLEAFSLPTDEPIIITLSKDECYGEAKEDIIDENNVDDDEAVKI